MKKSNTYIKNSLSGAVIALMVLTPAFAFAKENNNNEDNNKQEIKISSETHISNSLNENDNEQEYSSTSLTNNSKENEDSQSQNNLSKDEEKEHSEESENHSDKEHDKYNLGSCFKTLRDLTMADILSLNLANTTKLSEICFGTTSTTTGTVTDVTAPIINTTITEASTSTIKVTVTTNETSKVKVFYSTNAIDTNLSTSHVESLALATTTILTISNLTPNTTYNLVVEAKDQSGNTKTGRNFTAKTTTILTTSPVISNVTASTGSSTIGISWLTNSLATSKVFVSTSTPIDTSTTSTSFIENLSLVTNHVLTIPGLVANTIYNMVIQSKDAIGNIVNSIEFHVATTPAV